MSIELEREPEQTYRCLGCGGTSDSREVMERHQNGCALWLRQRIAALEMENERLRSALR